MWGAHRWPDDGSHEEAEEGGMVVEDVPIGKESLDPRPGDVEMLGLVRFTRGGGPT